jgi:hypothetical protein
MYWKPDLRCVVCKRIIGGDSKLQRRLNECSRFIKGGEPWSRIAKDIKCTNKSLGNHLTRHQNPDQVAGAIIKGDIIQGDVVKQRMRAQDYTDKILAAALDENGDLKQHIVDKMTPNAVTQATKQKFEYEKWDDKKSAFEMIMYAMVADSRKESVDSLDSRKEPDGRLESGTDEPLKAQITKGV